MVGETGRGRGVETTHQQNNDEGASKGTRNGFFGLFGRAMQMVGNLLMQPVCLSCQRQLNGHDTLCARCWRSIAFIRPPLCDRLGLPLPFGGRDGPLVSAAAAASPPLYGRARAVGAFEVDGVLRNLVHGMKYADRHDARRLFGRWLADAGRDLLADAHLIVPVPLTRWRLMRRQFNQSALVAKEVSRITGVPTDPLVLRKVRSTPPQVGLTREQRRRNVRAAFAVRAKDQSRIAGRNVVLLDDVVTTGATVEACTRTLLDAGAARVDVLALGLVVEPLQVSP
jgi:ComF family protein